MPTILTHAAVPLAMRWSLGNGAISKRLLFTGIVVSMIPDLDVIAFQFGIPYASQFGHRGFTHSLVFACLLTLLGTTILTRYLRSPPRRTFIFMLLCTASHGLLDTFTNGGLGAALLWPFSEARYFAPYRPIQVSPIGLKGIMSEYGLSVLRSEFLWVWLPMFTATTFVMLLRQLFSRMRQGKIAIIDKLND